MKDTPPNARPREKLLALGPAALADAELIALLLRTGLPGLSVLQMAQQMLDRFGGLAGLLHAGPGELKHVKGLGPAKRAEMSAVMELARRSLVQQLGDKPVFDTPGKVKDYLQLQLGGRGHEVFAVLFLDAQSRLIRLEEMFRGSLTQTSVYPREVLKRALDLQAANVILAHNHPSGLAEPSRADELLTQTLKSALALVDVRVLDHMVVGQGQVVSFAERGCCEAGAMKVRSLAELSALKGALLRARREAAERSAHEREQAARQRHERDLFAIAVGPVQPLRKAATPVPARPRPNPVPRQRQRDEAAVLVEALSDAFDVESLLDTDDALSFRRRGIGPEVVRKLRRGVWAIQAQLDLHGLRRDAARERLAEFMRASVRDGLRCVRVVHGKGNGSPGREPVLKSRVKGWLVQKSEVMAFTQARASDGGHGALLVLLRPTQARAPDQVSEVMRKAATAAKPA